MDFPNRKPGPAETPPAALLAGLSLPPAEVHRSAQAWFAVYESEAQVRTLQPDLQQLLQLAPLDIVATAPGDDVDFVSRYFWPANGGDEDPVTGSIHAGLAPYWAERLGRQRLRAYQASRRGGSLFCEVRGERVSVAGRAVPYLRGTIEV